MYWDMLDALALNLCLRQMHSGIETIIAKL